MDADTYTDTTWTQRQTKHTQKTYTPEGERQRHCLLKSLWKQDDEASDTARPQSTNLCVVLTCITRAQTTHIYIHTLPHTTHNTHTPSNHTHIRSLTHSPIHSLFPRLFSLFLSLSLSHTQTHTCTYTHAFTQRHTHTTFTHQWVRG